MSVRLGIPLLIQEGWLRHQEKMRSHRGGADGVVGIDEVFQTGSIKEVPFSTIIDASPYQARASRPSTP